MNKLSIMYSFILKKNRNEPCDSVHFGDGLNLETGELCEIIIPDSLRRKHFICFGRARIGKTKMLEDIVKSDIRKGYDVIVIDPKADGELLNQISKTAINHEGKVFSAFYRNISDLEKILWHFFMSVSTKENASYQSILVVQLSPMNSKLIEMVTNIVLSSAKDFSKKISSPLAVHIDESQLTNYRDIEELINETSATNIMLHFYYQSISQIYSIIPDKEKVGSLLDKFGVKLFMSVADKNTDNFVTKYFRGQVKTDNILHLPPRGFYMATDNKMYQGKMKEVKENNDNIVEVYLWDIHI